MPLDGSEQVSDYLSILSILRVMKMPKASEFDRRRSDNALDGYSDYIFEQFLRSPEADCVVVEPISGLAELVAEVTGTTALLSANLRPEGERNLVWVFVRKGSETQERLEQYIEKRAREVSDFVQKEFARAPSAKYCAVFDIDHAVALRAASILGIDVKEHEKRNFSFIRA